MSKKTKDVTWRTIMFSQTPEELRRREEQRRRNAGVHTGGRPSRSAQRRAAIKDSSGY